LHFDYGNFNHQIHYFHHVNLEIKKDFAFTQKFNISKVFVAFLGEYNDVILVRHEAWLVVVIRKGEDLGVQQVTFTVEFVFEHLNCLSV